MAKLLRGQPLLNIDLLTELNAKCEMENMLRAPSLKYCADSFIFYPWVFLNIPPDGLVVIYI